MTIEKLDKLIDSHHKLISWASEGGQLDPESDPVTDQEVSNLIQMLEHQSEKVNILSGSKMQEAITLDEIKRIIFKWHER